MLTVGVILNQLFDRMTQMIQQMQNAGLILEVNAGAQIQSAINQALAAYHDALNSTVSAMSAQDQQVISGLQSVVDNFKTGVVDDLTAKTQVIVDSLPFHDHYPRLSGYEGNMVSSNGGTSFNFNIKGNFPDVGKEGYDAYLTFSGQNIKNTTSTTLDISFSVDKSLLSFPDSKVSYVSFTINIPYNQPILFFNHRKIASYNFVLLFCQNRPEHLYCRPPVKLM